jgi:hypothetical protein
MRARWPTGIIAQDCAAQDKRGRNARSKLDLDQGLFRRCSDKGASQQCRSRRSRAGNTWSTPKRPGPSAQGAAAYFKGTAKTEHTDHFTKEARLFRIGCQQRSQSQIGADSSKAIARGMEYSTCFRQPAPATGTSSSRTACRRGAASRAHQRQRGVILANRLGCLIEHTALFPQRVASPGSLG